MSASALPQVESDYTRRSKISAIAFARLRCFGQALVQFMMVGQRGSNASPLPKRLHSSSSASRTKNTCHIRLLDGKKVFLKDQVLEAPNVEGRLYVSRKERRPEKWDPPVEQYDPYGPGGSHEFDIIA
jgi:hypothetical protein